MIDFRIELSVFRGPLDLLLYLVRKHEVEIVDIPIATITDQYLEYLAVIEQLDAKIERMTVAWNRPVVPEVGDAGLSAA